MDLIGDIASFLVIAQEAGGEAEEEGGSFLVSPNVGLMIWTLLAFGTTLYLSTSSRSRASPRRSTGAGEAIEESIDARRAHPREADELLEEYRARLREAREQADDIVARARKAARNARGPGQGGCAKQREELMARTPARHRGGDPPRARGDPQGGGRPHRHRDREGHAQVARRRTTIAG